MTEKKPKRDDPEQSKRSIATAKEVEAGDEDALDRAFKRAIKATPSSASKEHRKTTGRDR